MSLSQRFPDRNAARCSIGRPSGKGVRLGFPGWGEFDLALDPVLPLDMQVSSLKLEGAFKKVESKDLLHRIHGDCTLTHGINGIVSLMKPGGKLTLEWLSLGDILRVAGGLLYAKDWVGAQATEKFAFGQAVDETGVLYPQTMLPVRKAVRLLNKTGCTDIKVVKEPVQEWKALLPDLVRLKDVEDKVWEASVRNFKCRDSLTFDRPTCVICDRVVTKRDHDRQYYSRYCKEHYHQARERCDAQVREAFSVVIQARRRS